MTDFQSKQLDYGRSGDRTRYPKHSRALTTPLRLEPRHLETPGLLGNFSTVSFNSIVCSDHSGRFSKIEQYVSVLFLTITLTTIRLNAETNVP